MYTSNNIENFSTCEYNEFTNIINSKNITSVFQPIVSLKDGSIIGYEALSRGPKDSLMKSPETLLNIAKRYNKLWEIEEVFRSSALESISRQNIKCKIFLNVNPLIIESIRFKNSFTNEYLKRYCLGYENIVFEITEKEKIENRERFRDAINDKKSQNYKLAIDDFGAGYSGFGRVYDIKPDYIKIDMDIIRDINKDETKQALVKSMYEYSKLSKCSLIAEGIETKEEMETLIEIGVHYGQGYFIQKPKENIESIDEDIVNLIKDLNKEDSHTYSLFNVCIGEISKKEEAINFNTLVSEVDTMLKKN